MINAYPIAVIDSYKKHKDYYRVSAVSGVTGGKTSTSRQPLDLPYDRSMYKQLAQTTAQQLAGLVQSAQNVKQSAQALVENRLSDVQSLPIRDFLNAFTQFQNHLLESPAYLKRSILQGQEQAAEPLTESGISELAESTLDQKSLKGITSFAESLSSRLGQLEKQPAEALFQMDSSPLKPYGQYRSQLQAYLPVPMSGLLLDRRM